MPIEIKSRLSHTTFYDERDCLQVNLGFNAWTDSEASYVELETESEELFRRTHESQEMFQLLHHCVIRDSLKELIIIGDNDDVMFGVFVTYKQETTNAYKKVLQRIYKRVLKSFYQDPKDLPQKR